MISSLGTFSYKLRMENEQFLSLYDVAVQKNTAETPQPNIKRSM